MKTGLSIIISALTPSTRDFFFDIHRCEQYVSTQMVSGKDVPTHGEAKTYGLRVTHVAVQVLLS
jgi:cellobiose phosphorylase